MLGYYVDNLFSSHYELFVKTIEFLLKGLMQEAADKALSLQCADTLKTVISDSDLVTRVEGFINNLFPSLAGMVGTMELPTFYEILMKIIASYKSVIDGSVISLLQSLVARVETEYKALRAKGEQNNMTINQCWNVIRAICEQDAFFPERADGIEQALLPMFNYLVDPTHIEFDDDMLQVIASLIKKRGGLSQPMILLFPYLPKFFEKYKGVFGSLLPTLNTFIFYGKETFIAQRDWLSLILHIAHTSMFNTQPPAALNNTEGAILCQLVLQTLGNGVMDEFIAPLIQETLKRLEQPPSAGYLTKELYNVVLCSLCNNGPLTLRTLEADGKTARVLQGIIEIAPSYQTSYDRKVLAIGLANLLIQPALPAAVIERATRILETIIVVLQLQTAEETKRQLKADRKVVAITQSGSESESESGSEANSNSNSDVEVDKGGKLEGLAPSAEVEMMDAAQGKAADKFVLSQYINRKRKYSNSDGSDTDSLPRDPVEDVQERTMSR
jgi:hypothetical protein